MGSPEGWFVAVGVVEYSADELEAFSLQAPRWSGVRFAQAMQRMIAKHYGITVRELRIDSREPKYTAARRQLYKVLRRAGWSYPRIGTFIGRHHTTIMWHVRERVPQ